MSKDEIDAAVELFQEGHIRQTDLLNALTDEILKMREKEITITVQILLLNKRFDIKLSKVGYTTWTRRKIEKGIFHSKNKLNTTKRNTSKKELRKKSKSTKDKKLEIDIHKEGNNDKPTTEAQINLNQNQKEKVQKMEEIEELKRRKFAGEELTIDEMRIIWNDTVVDFSDNNKS